MKKKARVIATGDVIEVTEVGDQEFADVEGNKYHGYELEILPEFSEMPKMPDWEGMVDALKQNQLIQPAASIAVEFMRSHPNAPAKKVLAFVTEVINGIKEL